MLEMTRQNLRKVISNVLESMFFIFIEPVSASECARDLTGVNFHQVQISLIGPQQKLDLDFFFAVSLAEQMAANFLGVDICDVNNLQVLDVLKEVVNMVAGGLVNICDPDGSILLGIPNIPETAVPGEDIIINSELNCYGSDDGYLLVRCLGN
ncbi:MAG: hypothetical protein U9P07_11575 [Pseudomonadota bacterium]|nr:hypothetical protein [Pseudomonadota bacterium]